MSSAERSTVLVVPVECAQKIRFELETLKLWDATHKLKKLPDSDQVAIPIIINGENISVVTDKWPDFMVARTCLPISKKAKVQQSNPAVRLQDELWQLLTLHGMSKELLNEVPSKWERHGDLVIIPAYTFSSPEWAAMGDRLWEVVARCLACKRLAHHSAVANNGFRSSKVIMRLGQNGEVTHVDNGIRYTYDVTKCMFSPGNITEKLRVANLDCKTETVVDLYAGIGYFTLPYLVHAKACHVHACEWNPDAITALKHNLLINGVAERCTIHEGDNRMLQLPPLADRVNLGLIPSSEEGWPVAVQVLTLSGGILHVHGNVTTFHRRRALDDKTEDLRDELQHSDTMNASVSEKDRWQTSQQTGKENALTSYNGNGDHSFFCLQGVAMDTAVLDQNIRDDVRGNESSFLESCMGLRENSGISDHSDSVLCDVSTQQKDHDTHQPHECLQHMSQKCRQISAQTVTSQVTYECGHVASDPRKSAHSEDRAEGYNMNSEDSAEEYNMNSEDSCQGRLHTYADNTSDNGLDKVGQNRKGKNVLACEKWSLFVQKQIKSLLEAKKGGAWAVTVLHLEIVKSYAPHIVHAVLDLECRPV
ncbi:hypothetical protein BsWGS_07174 [Bradybaena similaris]